VLPLADGVLLVPAEPDVLPLADGLLLVPAEPEVLPLADGLLLVPAEPDVLPLADGLLLVPAEPDVLPLADGLLLDPDELPEPGMVLLDEPDAAVCSLLPGLTVDAGGQSWLVVVEPELLGLELPEVELPELELPELCATAIGAIPTARPRASKRAINFVIARFLLPAAVRPVEFDLSLPFGCLLGGETCANSVPVRAGHAGAPDGATWRGRGPRWRASRRAVASRQPLGTKTYRPGTVSPQPARRPSGVWRSPNGQRRATRPELSGAGGGSRSRRSRSAPWAGGT
jgi:hypothetical protein